MKKQNIKGFTLIELLLYISISTIILMSISFFLFSLLSSRIKNQTIAELEQQGVQVMQIITQVIHNSENINSPNQGASASILSLDTVNLSLDPTVFDLSGDTIQITEGAGVATALINSRIIASGLGFQNLSRNNTPNIIRIQFTLSHINPEGKNEYNYSKMFYGSASLR